MQRQWIRRLVLPIVTVFVVLAAPSYAARKDQASVETGGEIARAQVAPHLLSFQPLADYESMTLRIKGDSGLVFEGEFRAGENILFDLYDQHGEALADGTYIYELRAVPRIPAEIRLAMQEARDSGTEAETKERLRAVGMLPERGAMAISGAFTVLNGELVDPNLPEEAFDAPVNPGYHAGSAAPQDQVVNDDKIIIGSLCVGFDCINGESFGFDTIRMKENNLRLHFQDTSNSASFPTRDWRWVANSSANGGANFMGLEDTDNAGRFTFQVFSGASNHALVVDAQGDVGLSTDIPVTELHIVDGDTPTLRLEQDGSSGFTQQTWDVAGNETNFFIRDVTNGSRLPFRIRPGAATSSIDVSAAGEVGFGTSSPVANGITVEGGSANEAVVKLCHTGSGCTATGDGANLTLNNSDLFYTNRENGDLFFFTNNAQKMLLDNNNNHTITGNLAISGTLSKGGGAFKIDHPLDPANKNLSHSFVESPDMMNIYNGNARLDGEGAAWVELPGWFEALNRDFRYQLTAIGAPAPNIYIAEPISGNRFKIAGGTPGAEVSWQVTGVRHDRWAEANRIRVEEDKPVNQRGQYLHPELFESPAVERAAESGAPAKSTVAKERD